MLHNGCIPGVAMSLRRVSRDPRNVAYLGNVCRDNFSIIFKHTAVG